MTFVMESHFEFHQAGAAKNVWPRPTTSGHSPRTTIDGSLFHGRKTKTRQTETSLVTRLREDLKEAGIKLETGNDLNELRENAADREWWRNVMRMCGACRR